MNNNSIIIYLLDLKLLNKDLYNNHEFVTINLGDEIKNYKQK